MTQTIAVPTGRRKITQSMLSARAALPDRHESTTPGKALSAFKRASNTLGIPRRLVELVDYLVGRTFAVDWQGDKIIAWPSNATLCDALDIGRSQIKTLIRVGQELGLFEMRDAPNGQRYGHRGADGRIDVGYGFDLAPLARRHQEFEQIAAAHMERRTEGRRLRAQITAERNAILSLCDMARDIAAAGDWEQLDAEARRLAALRGNSYDPRALTELFAELVELRAHATGMLSPAENYCASVETGPMGPENRPSLTPTNKPSIPKGNTSENTDGPSRPDSISRDPASHSSSVTIQRLTKAGSVKTDKRERRRESALRGFVVTPDFILAVAPAFQNWIQTTKPTLRDLLEAAYLVRSELGISQHAWGQACSLLGQVEVIATIAAISAKHEAGLVKSPGGLLRRMVELHEQGQLRLDRTLFGLADGLKRMTH